MTVELAAAQFMCRSVERLITARGGFDLPASDVQLALCRVLDGAPMGALAASPAVLRAFGGVCPAGPAPREMCIFSGVRVGKSLLAGAVAIKWSQTIDVWHLRHGEIPRIAIVSTQMDNAKVVYGHIAGTMTASPFLRTLLVDGIHAGLFIVARHLNMSARTLKRRLRLEGTTFKVVRD